MYDTPIDQLPQTSALTLGRLKSIGINTFGDLLKYFPVRYADFSLIETINKLQVGESATVKGVVVSAKNSYTRRRGFTIQNILVDDDTGKIEITWFNQPYILRNIKEGMRIAVAGVVAKSSTGIKLEPKEYELTGDSKDTVHTGRIVPYYSEKRGLSSRLLREKISTVLTLTSTSKPAPDPLPTKIRKKYNLIPQETAIRLIHFPPDLKSQESATYRLAFDEFFIIQLSAALTREKWKNEKDGHAFEIKKYENKILDFTKNLPFKLTDSQNKVIHEITKDLQNAYPMNRFLQGDVGSGKTVVAAIAALAAQLNGFQTLFMAPTEILANQHFSTLSSLFQKTSIKVGLHTGSAKINKSENYDIVIGTHALIQKTVNLGRVGLVVIDEQHRFGVRQRAKLKEKGINPHLLTMTATPIPRTVALTLYGELDISVIDQMPVGRIPIKTHLVPKIKRDKGYGWIADQVKDTGSQVFVVCPLIEESEHETMQTVRAATAEYEKLKTTIFKHLTVGLIHGKLKPAEKNQIMLDFQNKKYDVLVTTTVVEVGIDVANATIMLIEGAERFGLAQLHQLRGRVGRGAKKSYCFLFTETENEAVKNRLEYFAHTELGAQVAEYDFKHRGAGDIYGLRQHGASSLAIANLSDYALIKETQDSVSEFVKEYKIEDFPELNQIIKNYQFDLIAKD